VGGLGAGGLGVEALRWFGWVGIGIGNGSAPDTMRKLRVLRWNYLVELVRAQASRSNHIVI
jgi:hypothetical protein